jgi:hypothetical protein
VLFDTNRTPTRNPNSKLVSSSNVVSDLARGIEAFLPGSDLTKTVTLTKANAA